MSDLAGELRMSIEDDLLAMQKNALSWCEKLEDAQSPLLSLGPIWALRASFEDLYDQLEATIEEFRNRRGMLLKIIAKECVAERHRRKEEEPGIDRWRGTEQEAREQLKQSGNMIIHLLSNDDGTFSLMRHIVCEHCHYCDVQGDCRCREDEVEATPYVKNPYPEG